MTGRNWDYIRTIFLVGLSLVVLATTTITAVADEYEANWRSLDQRATPQWWQDAKFGIFIHWGVYSVPSYSPVGTYSEWYWERTNVGNTLLERPGDFKIPESDQVRDFHLSNYGESFAYADFVPMFQAELFDPAQWAALFKRSGAKYVVLTSKHHDGFALWPSEAASRSWGRPWNAASAGPRRDLAGDLASAVRQQGLEMGFYYSLYEWYNPVYRADFGSYVSLVAQPQLRDLVERYEPSILFADGEWLHTSKDWKSEEFIAWLYNESAVKDRVVINDRWGSDTRHQHGGYYTTEYGAGLPDATNPWEESRGMGTSYGYNRAESVEDYSSSQQLILTLVDTVSRGGNLLLNIGPTADGRIPVVMQDRLSAIGRWLDKNGEAIYGTHPWKRSAQWTPGSRAEFGVETHAAASYDVMELLVSPPEGSARKEILFTESDAAIYAILPVFPGMPVTIQDIATDHDTTITMLGYDSGPLEWSSNGDEIVVAMPNVVPGQLGFTEAFVIRISK